MNPTILALLGLASAAQSYPSCGGLTPEPTPCEGTCVSDPRKDGCGLACDQPGICLGEDVPQCGGIVGKPCPEGLECFDDPRDECDPENGGADCFGICLEALEEVPRCGGYEGKECPEGLACVDDPDDECDPEDGGFDCSGVCLEVERGDSVV